RFSLTEVTRSRRRSDRMKRGSPLLAQSGHAETICYLSAFGGKADIAVASPRSSPPLLTPSDIEGTEIPQCSGLRAYVYATLSMESTGEGGAPHLNSEQFRSAPRACQSLCGRLTVR